MAAVGRPVTACATPLDVKLEQVKLQQCDTAHLLLVESIFSHTVNFLLLPLWFSIRMSNNLFANRCKSMIGRFIGCNQIRFLQDIAILVEIFLSPSNYILDVPTGTKI